MESYNKIAFITWDSPETNYLETLFLPIFKELNSTYNYQFYVIQFSWLSAEAIKTRTELVQSYGFNFLYIPVSLKPIATIGKFLTIFKHIKTIQNYCNQHQINWVMPRSLMPALLVNNCSFKTAKIIYDADGLPIEERLESNLLKNNGLLHKFYEKIQRKIIEKAQVVITRSTFANQYLSSKYNQPLTKFYKVVNGKSNEQFFYNEKLRQQIRLQLNIKPEITVFIYCGSIGPKYQITEMLSIFKSYYERNSNTKFIILSNQVHLITTEHPDIIKLSVASKKVVEYLNAADVGLALITESKSMKAAAAIKHAEYLMCGVPTILTEVGDVLNVTETTPYIYHYSQESQPKNIDDFIEKSLNFNREEIASQAKKYFSIENAALTYYNALCQNK